ncbi:hypothetical protein [Azospirillum halopraeferens]|uniref:hypothetical protein n=1 Tax=Azospirillum halopraeferens TaxID=34010 RepID=UPI00041992FB|nr:hypothetical protein [Azospirillum halopraeferens]
MAVPDEVRKRFAEYVKVQALDSRFISRDTERKILEDGVMRFEIGLDDGRQIMLGVAQECGYVFETEAEKRIRDILDGYAEDGRIDKREFTESVAFLRKFCANGLSEDEARKRVKKIMLANGWKPKRRGLLGTKRWFTRVEAD